MEALIHTHICPVCFLRRERPECTIDDDKVKMGDVSCWEACPQHQAQWDDQIRDRPGAFDAGE